VLTWKVLSYTYQRKLAREDSPLEGDQIEVADEVEVVGEVEETQEEGMWRCRYCQPALPLPLERLPKHQHREIPIGSSPVSRAVEGGDDEETRTNPLRTGLSMEELSAGD
jgi:hypothetical protein